MRIHQLIISALPVMLACFQAQADVTLAEIYGDNMILQRDMPLVVRGTADVGEQVKVEFDGASASAKAAADGSWRVTLKAHKAGTNYVLTVRGTTRTIELKNVAVGDIWLCSGQSNMDTLVSYYHQKAPDIVTTASYEKADPNLRLFVVGRNAVKEPLSDLSPGNKKNTGIWQESSIDTNYKFSALGYFFGKNLRPSIDVPVGLIHSAVGGSLVRAWVPREVMSESSLLRPFLDFNDEKTLERHRPDEYYNGMIAPLHQFPIKGVVWYQGESDTGFTDYARLHYGDLFGAMIQSWRKNWNEPNMPFVYVILAGYMNSKTNEDNPIYVLLRDEQYKTLDEVPYTAAVSAVDLGMEEDIHPPYKLPLAERMTSAVLNLAYGRKDIVANGPRLKRMKLSQNKRSLELTFDNVGSGLKATTVTLDKRVMSGDKLQGFSICGEDGVYFNVPARIVGKNKVVLKINRYVTEPQNVRYAWANYPLCNLYNAEGLPAAPFRKEIDED